MRFTLKSGNDAIAFIGGGIGDTQGWTLCSVDGWFGSPDVRESPVGMSMEDGDYFPNTLSQGARVVTLSILYKGSSSVDVETAINRVNAMIGKHLELVAETADGSKTCECYISADPEPNTTTHAQAVSMDIILTCPDPRKYGIRASYDYKPVLTIANNGNVDMYPIVNIQGTNENITEFRYTCKGKSLKWTGDARAITLDLKNMTASSGIFTEPVLVPIPAGSAMVEMSANTAVSGTVSVQPAWR